LDAIHFRNRAAKAREMARAGDDVRLAQMLLEVASDLEAEAAVIEAEQRDAARTPPGRALRATLTGLDGDTRVRSVQIIDISLSGAKFQADGCHGAGSPVVLELPCFGLHLEGTIVRAGEREAAMMFDPSSRSAPGLAQLVLSGQRMHAPAMS